MKKIKIKIINYDPNDPLSYGAFLIKILSRYYEVEFSEVPDYIFYNESTFDHLKYDCVKIFYTGENISPDFNFCDYAIGFDHLTFQDRYYRLPLYLLTQFYRSEELKIYPKNTLLTEQNEFTKEDLDKKTEFCSFVYSNYQSDPARENFFNKLQTYKKVNSGGRFLNNTGGSTDNKLSFESKHKFSIAFENSSRSGYTTEKLTNALIAQTIPIYWGNPDIGLEFNEQRFINCHKFANFDEVVKRVKEIDNDSDLYLKIINQPIAGQLDHQSILTGFENFLKNIFNQEITVAKRSSINSARKFDLLMFAKITAGLFRAKSKFKVALATIYKPFRKFKFFEKIKHTLLKF